MKVVRSRRQRGADPCRRDDLGPRAGGLVDDDGRNPDVGQHQGAGQAGRGRHEQRHLRRAQRHRHRRLDRGADHLRRVGGQPGREIDCDDRRPCRIQVADQRRPAAGQRAGQPGPEQGIDDHIAVRDLRQPLGPLRRGRHLADRHTGRTEHGEVAAGVPGHRRRRRRQIHAHVHARGGQLARRHAPVTAVVALAAHDRHPLPIRRREMPRDGGGDLAAGVLHQLRRRHADLLDRAALGGTHLGRGQDTHGIDSRSFRREGLRTSPAAPGEDVSAVWYPVAAAAARAERPAAFDRRCLAPSTSRPTHPTCRPGGRWTPRSTSMA